MNDAVIIEPTRSTVACGQDELPVLELSLGRTPRGLVLVLCERSDLDREAPRIMNRLALHGYCSLAAEVDQPNGEYAQRLSEVAVERDWAPDQIGMVGLGHGGLTCLAAAASIRIGAAVSLSPTVEVGTAWAGSPFEGVAEVMTPWLGLLGEADPGVSPTEINALRARLYDRSDVHTQVVTYPGVGRDFPLHGDDGLSYAACYDGWQRTVEWLELRVAPRLTPLAEQWRRRRAAMSG